MHIVHKYAYVVRNDRLLQVREALKQLFRTCNRQALQEVVLVIGGSCILPHEIYRIPINLCDICDANSSICGDICGELTSKYALCVQSSVDVWSFNTKIWYWEVPSVFGTLVVQNLST